MEHFYIKYSAEWQQLIDDSFKAMTILKQWQIKAIEARKDTNGIDSIINVLHAVTQRLVQPNELSLMQIRIDLLERTNLALAGELADLKKQIEIDKQIGEF